MLALFRKEARQVLIAHVGLAVLYSIVLIALAPEDWMLIPEERSGQTYFVAALFSMVQGTLIGLGSFGLESWGHTEAYLRHRPAPSSRIFWMKVLAGLLALGLTMALPIAVYGAWHLVLFPTIDGARATRILHLAAATTAGVPALAIAVFGARLRKTWFVRWLYVVLGLCTLVLATRWSASPMGSEVLPSAARFCAIQVSIAALVLAVASEMFQAGEDAYLPWRGRSALLAAVASLALFWSPYAVGIGELQKGLLKRLFEGYPRVIEHRTEGLMRVVQDDSYDCWPVDEHEQETSSEPLDDYRGLGFDLNPYLNLFDARSTPMTSTRPRGDPGSGSVRAASFEFEGPVFVSYYWFVQDRYSSAWFFMYPSMLAALQTSYDSRKQLMWFTTRPDGRSFSPGTVVVFPLGVDPDYGTSLNVAEVLFFDRADRSLWKFELEEQEFSVHPIELPAGDTLERIERIHSLFFMRAGLYEPLGLSDGIAFVGKRDRYVWTSAGFVAKSQGASFEAAIARGVLEEDAANAQAWRLEPSRIDGVSFHLDVIDVKTGEVALAHDYRPRTLKQRAIAASAIALSLARPPVGEVVSFVGRPYDELEVYRRAGPLKDPFVGDGVRPALALAVVVLGIALAVSTWRWIGAAAEDRAVRWFWTLAVAALGLPAWVLCRVIEPSRRTLSLRMPGSARHVAPLLVTPRRESAPPVPAMQA